MLELRPNHCVALLMGAMNELWANGDVERAQDFIERACALMPDNPTGEMCGAMIEAARGHQASACKRMNRTLAKYQNTYVSPIHAAMAFGALRNRDGVMRELRRAYDLHDVLVVEVCVDPFYEWLRTDSQFDSFLRSLGLPGWVGRSAGSPALDSLPGRVQNEKG